MDILPSNPNDENLKQPRITSECENLCVQILQANCDWNQDRVDALLGLMDEEDHLERKLYDKIDWKGIINEYVYGRKKKEIKVAGGGDVSQSIEDSSNLCTLDNNN